MPDVSLEIPALVADPLTSLTSTISGAAPTPFIASSDIVTFVRPELVAASPNYELIRDCIAGESAIKRAGPKYLPIPNATDKSDENLARYAAYKTRAVFYNATGRTGKGMVGQIFAQNPVVELPTGLEDTVHVDCDGTGISLEQGAKKTAEAVISFGRSGLFTDFPTTNHAISKAEIQQGDIKPVILHYDPWQIRNWQTTIRGSRIVYTLVVLMEPIQVPQGKFGLIETNQFRVLRLDAGGLYEVEMWLESTPGGGDWQMQDVYTPVDSKGNRLDTIPFTFVGSENNDATFDDPPLYDLACVNIAHYRNSADNEESTFITGQPTIVVTGLDQAWLEGVLKGKLEMGSRGGIPLQVGSDAKLLQAQPNTMPKDGMLHKEMQMVHLGARIAESPSMQKTATQAAFDESSETSILSSTANNVSEAYTAALKFAAAFTGDTPDSIQFTLNQEFDVARLDFNDRRQTIAEWQSDAISFTEMRTRLRRAGVATLDDDEAKEEIEADHAEMLEGLSVELGVMNTTLVPSGDPNAPADPNAPVDPNAPKPTVPVPAPKSGAKPPKQRAKISRTR